VSGNAVTLEPNGVRNITGLPPKQRDEPSRTRCDVAGAFKNRIDPTGFTRTNHLATE
jgi:hypothetical protein